MKHRILLVDDEEALRMLLAEILEHSGYDIVHAENGVQALECLRAEPRDEIDLVLTDINMPQMDGVALIEALSQEYPALPVLVMTAYGDRDLILRLLRIGINDYIDKPIRRDQLCGQVRKILMSTASGDAAKELAALQQEMNRLVHAEVDRQKQEVLQWLQGGVSHRFNQPLTVLRMNVSLLEKIHQKSSLMSSGTEMIPEILQDIRSATLCISDLVTMVNRMQDFRPTNYLENEAILDFEGSAQ